MNQRPRIRRRAHAVVPATAALVLCVASCSSWHGANTLDLPGTEGHSNNPFTIQAQLPDVDFLERNSRVRAGDVTVGSVTKIERQGWHALLTMSINGDVVLPENITVTVGQTSLLGSLHVELAPPTDAPPQGRLHNGSLIPLSRGAMYPSTEQTLSAVSMLLNNGGIGRVQDITESLSTAFSGREADLRNLLNQLDIFIMNTNDQTDDIIAATDSLNGLMSQFAAQQPTLDQATRVLPDALKVLSDQRDQLAEAIDQLGKFSAITADSVNHTKDNLVREFQQLGPVLQSLADAGPALTRSLSFFATFPWPKETIGKWYRGDYANLTAVLDLTLSRIDAALFTGTRWEGNLTELEMQWGRTIGQMPSPYTAGNPLIVPYHWDQGS
jgi:phospholipid/cholesterol/gamma-HCH transport system substrate-binding protein